MTCRRLSLKSSIPSGSRVSRKAVAIHLSLSERSAYVSEQLWNRKAVHFNILECDNVVIHDYACTGFSGRQDHSARLATHRAKPFDRERMRHCPELECMNQIFAPNICGHRTLPVGCFSGAPALRKLNCTLLEQGAVGTRPAQLEHVFGGIHRAMRLHAGNVAAGAARYLYQYCFGS